MLVQTDARRSTLPPETKEAITASLTDPLPSATIASAKQAEAVAKRWAGEDLKAYK